MWARVMEFMLACWIAMSPFIFRYDGDATFLWANDFVCAVLVAAFALLSFMRRLDKIHLLTGAVVLWLIGVAFVQPEPAPPFQNYIVTALILGMLAILPSRSDKIPEAWQRFYADE